MIDDPEDKKPEGYDDIPAQIPDPDATKPEVRGASCRSRSRYNNIVIWYF